MLCYDLWMAKLGFSDPNEYWFSIAVILILDYNGNAFYRRPYKLTRMIKMPREEHVFIFKTNICCLQYMKATNEPNSSVRLADYQTGICEQIIAT